MTKWEDLGEESMDIATVVGISLCLIGVLGSILAGGDIMAFIDIPSVLVVGLGLDWCYLCQMAH